jgi:NADP-dependent 3-hydroxy acid dehydrogenase YdfG
MEKVEGKVAFITGGASGIGLGMAKAFAAGGMKVVIADIRQDALDEAMAYFKKTKHEVLPVKLDVTDRKAYAEAADKAESVFGKVHILVNNAGVGSGGLLQDSTFNDWDFVMGVNVTGVINGIVTFLPRMIKHGEGGHIVATSSSGGVFAVGGAGIYCASKYAVAGIIEGLATDLQGTGVNASVYFPGPIQSNLPITSEATRPDHLKNESQKNKPTGQDEKPQRPLFDQTVFMDPVEAGERVLRGIKRGDLFIMSHPEFSDGIKARNEALLRAIPDESPDEKRQSMLKYFGTLLYNPIYDKQTKPPAFKKGKE